MRRVPAGVAAVLLTLLAPAAHAVDGFIIGLEGQHGSWDADPAVLSEKGGIGFADAAAFALPLHEVGTSGVNLHLGWNVLGWAAIEAAVQTTFWTPFEQSTRGGVGLVGLRAAYFPLQHWLPTDRQVDLGLELGGGYMIAGGPTYGMAGNYLSTAASVEYYPVRWFSLALGYRHFFGFLDNFYYDFNNNVTRDVDGFTAGWGTVFLSTNFHLTAPQ